MDKISGIKQFLCDSIDKVLLRNEWDKWLRSLRLYLDDENVAGTVQKKNKLLHLRGPQLQEVAFNIPGAIEDYNPEENNDVFQILVNKLTEYFSPQRNSTFERHLFRSMKPSSDETLNKFLLRIRQQSAKCTFGKTAQQALEINLKNKLDDKVVVQKMMRTNKLIPYYGNAEYKVIQRMGNDLLLQGSDKTIPRNISQVKKIPQEIIESSPDKRTTTVVPTLPPTNVSDPEVLSQSQSPQERVPEKLENHAVEPEVEPLRLERKEGMWRPKRN